jgi:magnesium transporter
MLPPEEVEKVVAEIRAVADSRGDDSQVMELVEVGAIGPVGDKPAEQLTRQTMRMRRVTGSATSQKTPFDEDTLLVEDLRDAWPLLDLDERGDGLRVLPREDAEEFFIGLAAADQAALLLHFRAGQRRQWMRLLEPDDVADLIQHAANDHRALLLALLDAPTRKEVLALLAYAEDEAGGLMSTRYARLRPMMTADEAISYLRRQARDKIETIYYAYVLDPEQRLLGVVSFRDLFAADPKKVVSEIMETNVVRVSDEMDQETVSRFFAEHDLTVIPVVDKDGRMKGIVTVDDIVDVVQEEATEDAQKFGGLEALDMPYLVSTRSEMLKKRARWLTILLVGEMLTATALGFFQHELDKAIVLSLFLPLIISSGGNSGSQASTLVIRAMALGEVRIADWWLVFRREIQMGVLLGMILGSVAACRVIIWGAAGAYEGSAGAHFVLVGLTVAASLVGCVLWGTLMGAMLPFLLRKLGADPASASAPLVATLVDVSGIVIYFTIASTILTGTVIRDVPNACKVADASEIATAFGGTFTHADAKEHKLTSSCEWTGAQGQGSIAVRTEIADSDAYDDAKNELSSSAAPIEGMPDAVWDPATAQTVMLRGDTLLHVSFSGKLPIEKVHEAERAIATRIAARL